MSQVLITGGAGYVGTELVPLLLEAGHSIKVLDLFLYEDNLEDHPKLEKVQGDIRDIELVKATLKDCNSVIHLACISNDPSFDLDPQLGKSINLDAFEPLVVESKAANISRFINASSSSVYGIKSEKNVTEELDLDPLTDYSKYKAMCEKILLKHESENFHTVSIRPATVCGYSRRQRLDVIVNILVNCAHNKNKISIFGGSQLRPNIHIKDMCRLYKSLLEMDSKIFTGNVYNAGDVNYSVKELAQMVSGFYPDAQVETTPSDDNRSYHISSSKIKTELNFVPELGIPQAIEELKEAFNSGQLKDENSSLYYNVKRMQEVGLR